MEFLDPDLVREWCRLDPSVDTATLSLLETSAIECVEHEIGRKLRVHVIDGEQVTPVVPESIRHALVVFISAHFDNRSGAVDDAIRTVRRLCAPHRVMTL